MPKKSDKPEKPDKNVKKVFDITSPKKVTPAATSRPVIVSNRPMLSRDPMMNEDTGTPDMEKADIPGLHTLNPTARVAATIKPLSDKPSEESSEGPKADESVAETITVKTGSKNDDEAEPSAETPQPGPEQAPEEPEEPKEAVYPNSKVKITPPADAELPEEKPAAAGEPAKEETETSAEAPATSPADAAPKDTDGKNPPKNDAEVAKEEAAEKQRAYEMQKLIDSHQFYVPVNAVQRKRSTWTSIGLTLVVILLSIALLDLMLDANVIVLIEKLPHTHFFSPSPH